MTWYPSTSACVYIIPGSGQPSDPSENVWAFASTMLTADGSTPRRVAASATIGSVIDAGSEPPPLPAGSPDASAGEAEGSPEGALAPDGLLPLPPAVHAPSTMSAASRSRPGRSMARCYAHLAQARVDARPGGYPTASC